MPPLRPPIPLPRPDRQESLLHTLPTNRTLSYARYGHPNPTHPPIIYLHGFPSSRLEPSHASPALYAKNIQLLAIDRPGFGASSPDKARSLTSYAADIRSLAAHLGIKQYAVVGVSGGAPYALAAARQIPAHELVAVGVVAGMGPLELATAPAVWKKLWWVNKFGFWAPVHAPWLYRRVYKAVLPRMLRAAAKKPYATVMASRAVRKMDQADREMLEDLGEEGYRESIRAAEEALQQEEWVENHLDEVMLLAKKWEFGLDDITAERVRLYYGTLDKNTPVELGRLIKDQIPQAVLTEVEGGTHASVVMDLPKIIDDLLGLKGWSQ